MDRDRVARLSEGQRACLRMVYRHMETKEIARILGISPDGVAQRIKTAMRILGVHRRRDAARILAEVEAAAATPSYPPRVNPSWDIAGIAQAPNMPLSIAGERQPVCEPMSGGLREEQVAFETYFAPPAPVLPLPLGGARPNEIGWLRRLTWIVGIIIGVAIAFGGLFAGVDALVRLIVALNQH